MDRRDFLKLFAITAAGVYVPKTTYFFMPPRKRATIIQVPVLLQPEKAVFDPSGMLYLDGVATPVYGTITLEADDRISRGEFRDTVKRMLFESKDGFLLQPEFSGVGSKEWLEKTTNGKT